jgi:hypothetical protein
MQIWANLEGHLILLLVFFEKKIKRKKDYNFAKKGKSGIILRLKSKNPQIPQLMSNFPRFLGFWEFPNHKFRFPICYQISLDLGNFPRSGTTVSCLSGSVWFVCSPVTAFANGAKRV